MDEKKMKMLALTSAILAYKPPTMTKEDVKDFVMPEVIEPVAPSGQERRRERRKRARKK